MADSPQAAFGLIDSLTPELDSYHLFHATRADLFRRVGALEEATQSYTRALELVTNESERRFWNVGCAKFNLTFSPAKGLQQFKAPGIHDAVEKK